MLELVTTNNTNEFLQPIHRITDSDRYDKAFSDLQNNFNVTEDPTYKSIKNFASDNCPYTAFPASSGKGFDYNS
jgi:hypothetical protein